MGEPAEAVEVKVVVTKQRNSEVGPWEGLPGALEQRSFERLVQKKKSLRARYLYGIVFLFANLVAWCVRDYGQKVTPQLHCELARVGAGVFLILQLISVIEFITWWNNYWMPDETGKQSCFLGLFTSTLFYIASVFLLLVMLAISLHSKVNRGLLSSGIMASYIVFLCWSAIRSEPAAKKCSPQKHENEHGDWTTVLGFLIAIFAIVIATFSTGIDSQTFQFRKDEVQHEDDIPYKYGFFHLIFSLGAMYFAMLFISWNLDSSTRKWSIDVGWASTWVKIVNEWFAATIYTFNLEIDIPSCKTNQSHGSRRACAAGRQFRVIVISFLDVNCRCKQKLTNLSLVHKHFKMSKQSTPTLFIAILIAAIHVVNVAAAIEPATAGGEPVFELYLHDILGGSSPTARPVTGLLGNIYSGQVPFARPVGFLPPKGGVVIPNANGAIPTLNANGIPLGTGLAGTSFAGNPNNNGNTLSTQLGPDGLGLGFGTITVIDDILTLAPELGSQSLGKAQGVYVASSADGTTQMMAFTAMMEGGEYGDSLNFFGVYKIGSTMSRLSITGGTGKFKNACGFAEMRSLIPAGQHVTDGAETLLRITVHLSY
ncbi:unnamed protein product [Camellia sinensis]